MFGALCAERFGLIHKIVIFIQYHSVLPPGCSIYFYENVLWVVTDFDINIITHNNFQRLSPNRSCGEISRKLLVLSWQLSWESVNPRLVKTLFRAQPNLFF